MRCYFRHLGHIVAGRGPGSIDDEEAIKQAESLFQDRFGKFSEFEVWDGDRQIYRFGMETEFVDMNA